MNGQVLEIPSPSMRDLQADSAEARDGGELMNHGDLRLRLAHGAKNLWLRCSFRNADVASLRIGVHEGAIAHVAHVERPDGSIVVEFVTSLGGMRALLRMHGSTTLHCTSSLVPSADAAIAPMPRDVLLADAEGTVLTQQRGLRSGIVYATKRGPAPFSLFYLQNFSALTDYFAQTKLTPADTVGGHWPELGFALPAGEGCVLPCAREFVLSDALLTFAPEAPDDEQAYASIYLDLFAETYLALDRPATAFHPWPERAAGTFRALTTSPACAYVRQGRRYLPPYVGDETKPPESMVHFTLAANVREYDAWRGTASRLERALRTSAPDFFDETIGSIVRWLPGESFDEAQRDDNMSHEAMDSWYVHHSVFNTFRFARDGDGEAKELFAKSLRFLKRVAHRFDYRWPIFFNLRTLDIIRAEAQPGQSGETDVGGLYALLMIHAYEMFGDAEFLAEAEAAAARLHGFGFTLAYQLNTTGFAAEAALRLWKLTRNAQYLGLAELCLANIFDNLWLWECPYGHASSYRTFFGLFPLRDAPYLAPYEELEAHAKFNTFLALAAEDARPSVRLLIAEFQKYSLDRCWYFYPAALPASAIAGDVRNGRIERALDIPLEDLRDGTEPSGQVGQEIYGAGLAFVMTTRHFMPFAGGRNIAYADYPMYDLEEQADGCITWRAGGDPRASAEVRVWSTAAEPDPYVVNAWSVTGEVRVSLPGSVSVEGHAVFAIAGGETIEVACSAYDPATAPEGLVIGNPEQPITS